MLSVGAFKYHRHVLREFPAEVAVRARRRDVPVTCKMTRMTAWFVAQTAPV